MRTAGKKDGRVFKRAFAPKGANALSRSTLVTKITIVIEVYVADFLIEKLLIFRSLVIQ